MRMHGTLTKWNDDRGYGFVALPQSHEEIFVHISAFPRSGNRPCIGEMLSFEVRTGSDGRKRAEGVVRPGATAPARERRNTSTRRAQSRIARAMAIGAAGIVGAAGYLSFASHQSDDDASDPAVSVSREPLSVAIGSFKCDGRTRCAQLTSCAEARYFLKNCPSVQLDGDHDGEPCEGQWCN